MTLRCGHAVSAVGSRPYLNTGLSGSHGNQWYGVSTILPACTRLAERAQPKNRRVLC
jgi:hypothetical protein